jgi:ketosteroid isomerase-like protein
MPAPMNDYMTHVLLGESDPEIGALEAALRRAQLDADVAALDQLISGHLLFTVPDGQLITKSQDLGAHASGQVRFLRHVPLELRVRRVGSDVAITALCADLTVAVAGTAIEGRFRYTRVWAREREQVWRVVGGHVATVPAQHTDVAPERRQAP